MGMTMLAQGSRKSQARRKRGLQHSGKRRGIQSTGSLLVVETMNTFVLALFGMVSLQRSTAFQQPKPMNIDHNRRHMYDHCGKFSFGTDCTTVRLFSEKSSSSSSSSSSIDETEPTLMLQDEEDDINDVATPKVFGGEMNGRPTTTDREMISENDELIMTDDGWWSSSSMSCFVNFNDVTQPYMSREDSESVFVEFTDDGMCVPAGPVGQWKERIANLLVEPSVEIVIASVVLLNSLLVALSTLDQLDPYMSTIRMAQNAVATIFIVDFLGRWFSSSRDFGRFVFDSQFALDVLVVILPFIVSVTPTTFWDQIDMIPSALTRPSGLFNLQLLRVLRLRRFLQDLDTFERFIRRALGSWTGRIVVQQWQLQLSRVLLSLFTLLSVATGLIYTAENEVNPQIDNYFDALYFGLTTLTTVGLGDVYPITAQGKLVVCGSILFGVAVVPSQAAGLVEALLDRERVKSGRGSRIEVPSSNRPLPSPSSGSFDNGGGLLGLDTSVQCPNCGAKFHWVDAQFCYSCGKEMKP